MKKIFKWLPVVVIAVTIAVFSQNESLLKASNTKDDTIAQGVYIGSIDVGGMTEAEAKAEVDNYSESLQQTVFTLVGSDDKSIEATAEDLGVTVDSDMAVKEACAVAKSGNLIRRFKEEKDLEKDSVVIDMNLTMDKQKAANYLYKNGDSLNVKAQNMGLERSNGAFTVVQGKEGSEVDYVASVNDMLAYLRNDWDGTNNEIQLVVNTVEPKGSEEELAKVKDVLGTFSTKYGGGTSGRVTNVTNGCSKINGTVVYPGEEFSADAAMRPYTIDNGYDYGGAYENGKVVESLGGGICQVSSTLYNAVIRAELEISQRANHSMTVSYVDLSADAAIAGDYKDLKFVNNGKAPIYIEGVCGGGTITFTIYGQETRAANRKVSFESETIETLDPEVEYNVTADQPIGYYHVDQTPHVGYKARLWKIVTVDGVEQSRDIFNNSTYKSSKKVVSVGIGGATEEQAAQIQAAVDAKDDAQVEAIAASASPETPPEGEEGSSDTPADSGTPADSSTAGSDSSTNPAASSTPADNSQAGSQPSAENKPADSQTPAGDNPATPTGDNSQAGSQAPANQAQ